MKQFLGAIFIFAGFSYSLYVVWVEEFQFYLPITQNKAFSSETVFRFDFLNNSPEKPVYLHFYNEKCTNARINIDHIQRFISKYQNDFDFYLIDQSSQPKQKIRQELGLPSFLQIIPDPNGELFDYFNIRSTPHALILQPNGSIYFNGNYNNQNGLCGPTDIQWSAPAIALKFLKNHSNPPIFPTYQLVPKGCEISKL